MRESTNIFAAADGAFGGHAPSGVQARTLTAGICHRAAGMFKREELLNEARAYASAGDDIRQAFSRWFAEKSQATPPEIDDLAIACVLTHPREDQAAPPFYAPHADIPAILFHEAAGYLRDPAFVLDHERVHSRDLKLDDELAVCRRHLVQIPDRARDVVIACEALQARRERLTLRALSALCGMDSATLNHYRRYPRVERAVKGVLPLTTLERLTAALDAVERESVRNSTVIEQKQVAMRADLDERTVIVCKRGNVDFARRVTSAIALSRERYRAVIVARIMHALDDCEQEFAVYSQADVARRAGIPEDLLIDAKGWDAQAGARIERSAAGSLYRALERIIDRADRDGVDVTQVFLARELGVSESSLSSYKNLPRVGDLIRNGLAFSAVEKIRQAEASLLAEGIPLTLATVACRAGVHPSTVSRARSRHEDIRAQIIPDLTPRVHLTRYADAASARRRLDERRALYGREDCNTVGALDRSLENGGDRTLLRACRKFHVTLPQARPEAANWLTVYLNRMAETRSLGEAEAAGLWQRAHAGDVEAGEELMVRARPLVRFVIETDLREDVDPFGFKTDLLERLVRRGDEIIVDAYHAPEIEGGVLAHFQRELVAGLRRARIDHYAERRAHHRQTVSIDQPLGHNEEENFSLQQTRSLASRDLSPEEVVSVLDPDAIAQEAEMVARRDKASGVSVVRAPDKQVLAAALGQLLAREGAGQTREPGVVCRWALFMGGALGRLGTAIQGQVLLDLYALVDGTDLFAAEMAMRLGDLVRLDQQVHGLLRRFGVQTPSASQAFAVQAMVAGGNGDHADGAVSREEFLFQIQSNGIVVLESEPGAARLLVRLFLRRFEGLPLEDAARGILDAKVDFLTRQRHALEAARLLASEYCACTTDEGGSASATHGKEDAAVE